MEHGITEGISNNSVPQSTNGESENNEGRAVPSKRPIKRKSPETSAPNSRVIPLNSKDTRSDRKRIKQ